MPDTLTLISLDTAGEWRSPMRRLLCGLAFWHGRHRQRLDLAELDERLLADIGVTAQEARHESANPFWR